jgi:hypothetical protein
MKNKAIPIKMGNKKKAIPISSPIRIASSMFHPIRCVCKPVKIDQSEASPGALAGQKYKNRSCTQRDVKEIEITGTNPQEKALNPLAYLGVAKIFL